MEKVQVLMSTYNGERYIEEQINSILQQDYSEIYLLIRDDGSTDKTVNVLKRFAEDNKRITFYQGDNIGVINSFFDLLSNADPEMDFYSLSDQDDVWKTDKITKAVENLNRIKHLPSMYCCDTILVDDNLNQLDYKIKKGLKKPGFGNALGENICTGCTCVLNRQLRDLVIKDKPNNIVMHDWWIYLCASRFGKVIYDENAYIYYRQHGGNVIGTRSNYLDEFRYRIRNYKKRRGQLVKQALEFQRIFNVVATENELLYWILWAKKRPFYRIKILFTNKIYRQRRLDNAIFKILFLFGQVKV